ncbi:MAG TPA: hypothetical protein VEL74_14185 [Thermoanaerobaculia bacterium]|nr:hypothetical protein [Thermoanaerobaculia bacterium]
MRSFVQGSTSSVRPNHPNAFTASFLARLGERDEPPTAGDADVAGPWRIEAVVWRGGSGFGLFRLGETLARGFAPAAVFPSRWLALLGAAILPGTGKDPLLLLSKTPDADGAYPLALAGGGSGDGGDGGDGEDGPVGWFPLFEEKAVDGMNVLIHLLQSPESLSYLLEAAGAVALERCGAILDERLGREGAAAG